MRCGRSQRLIGLELDGRLGAREAARLDRHLAGCAACRAEREALAHAWGRLDALGAGPASREDWPAIQRRIVERRERRPWLRWPLPVRRALSAAALAGLAAIGLALGDGVAHAALGPDRAAEPLEAIAIADGFGPLPFGGPAPGVLLAGRDGRHR